MLVALAICCGIARADIYRFVDENGVVLYTNIPRPGLVGKVVVRDGRGPSVKRQSSEPGNYTSRIRQLYGTYIRAAAQASGVEAALIHAVISAESGYNPAARSRKGALGLMQLMPETARRYSVSDPRDPAQNINGGARYLRDLLRMFNNDVQLVLAAYNAGEEAVLKYGNRIPPYAETMAYVPRVLAYYKKYRAES